MEMRSRCKMNGENTAWIDCLARGEEEEKERRESYSAGYSDVYSAGYGAGHGAGHTFWGVEITSRREDKQAWQWG